MKIFVSVHFIDQRIYTYKIDKIQVWIFLGSLDYLSPQCNIFIFITNIT